MTEMSPRMSEVAIGMASGWCDWVARLASDGDDRLLVRGFFRHLPQCGIARMPEAFVIDRRHGREARLVRQCDFNAGREQHFHHVDLQLAFVLEVAPGALLDLQR